MSWRREKGKQTPTPEKRKVEVRHRPSGAALTATSADAQKVKCEICGKPHVTSRCWDLTRASKGVRWEKVRQRHLCLKCLGKGHSKETCNKRCERCQGEQHELLCRGPISGGGTAGSDASIAPVSQGFVTLAPSLQEAQVLMQVVQVEISGPQGPVAANVLFDTGCDRSFMSRQLVNRVKPEFVATETVSFASFGAEETSKAELRNLYSCELALKSSTSKRLVVTEVPALCLPLFRKAVPNHVLRQFRRGELAANYSVDSALPIDILVGLDY